MKTNKGYSKARKTNGVWEVQCLNCGVWIEGTIEGKKEHVCMSKEQQEKLSCIIKGLKSLTK